MRVGTSISAREVQHLPLIEHAHQLPGLEAAAVFPKLNCRHKLSSVHADMLRMHQTEQYTQTALCYQILSEFQRGCRGWDLHTMLLQ